jgi:hypothetical protein
VEALVTDELSECLVAVTPFVDRLKQAVQRYRRDDPDVMELIGASASIIGFLEAEMRLAFAKTCGDCGQKFTPMRERQIRCVRCQVESDR